MGSQLYTAGFMCLIATLLGGCSALRIDVDVYQGPLANDSETQVMQLASMALAARPLLDEAYRDKCNSQSQSQNKSSECVTLSGAIQMYRNSNSPEVQTALDDLDGKFESYKREKAAFEKLRLSSDISTDDVLKLLVFPADLDANVKKLKTDFGIATVQFAFPPSKDSIFLRSSNEMYNPKVVLKALRDLQSNAKDAACNELVVLPYANATDDLVSLWSNAKSRSNYLTCIFPNVSNSQSRLIDDHLRKFANAWNATRDALEISWNSLIKQGKILAASDTISVGDRKLIRDAFGRGIAKSTQPRNLACALEIGNGQTGNESLKAFSKLIDDRFPEGPMSAQKTKRIISWQPKDYDSANTALRAMAETDLTLMLIALQEANTAFVNAVPDDIRRCRSLSAELTEPKERSDTERTLSKVARESGIVRGPSLGDVAAAKELDELPQRLAELKASLSAGFSSGRESMGIEALSTMLVEERTRNSSNRSSTTLPRLRNALVSLGERMRYIANNAWTVSDEMDKQFDSNFRALLEAIGNSILSQADESWARHRYEESSKSLAASERAAIQSEFSGDASKVLSSLDAAIKGQISKAGVLTKDSSTKGKIATGIKLKKELELKAAIAALVTDEKNEKEAAVVLGNIFRAAELFATKKQLELIKLPESFAASSDSATMANDKKSLEDGFRKTIKQKPFNGFAQLGLSAKAIADATKEESQRKTRLSSAADAFTQLAEKKKNRKDSDSLIKIADAVVAEATFLSGVWEEKSERLKATLELKKARGTEIATLEIVIGAEAANKSEESALIEARKLITSAAGPALKKAREDEVINNPRAVLAYLRDMLPSPTAENTPIRDKALMLIESFSPPLVSLGLTKSKSGKTQQGEIDELIAQLRHRLLANTMTAGEEGLTTKNTKAALEEALRMRGNMTYIRPASAYLRSIYTTIFSRQGNGLQYENMLSKATLRSTPLVGGLFANGHDAKMREIQDGIDRAAWMNINTVTLNGGGSTNFVIVKDDVGNWYVKALSSDPAAIINSAKNLLLFNMSGRVDQNLLQMAEIRSKLSKTSDAGDRKALNAELDNAQSRSSKGNAAYNTVIKKYSEKYSANLESDFDKLAALIDSDSLPLALDDALGADKFTAINPELIDLMQGQSKAFTNLKTVMTVSKTDTERNEKFRKALRGLNMWADELKAKINGEGLASAEKSKLDLVVKEQSASALAFNSANEILIKSSKRVKTLTLELEEAKKQPETPETEKKVILSAAEKALIKDSDLLATAAIEKTAADEKVKAAGLVYQTKKDLVSAAMSAVDRVIKSDVVDVYLKRRLLAIKETQTGLLVLGEAMGNP